jgi:hypothetical protein
MRPPIGDTWSMEAIVYFVLAAFFIAIAAYQFSRRSRT